MVWPTTDVDTTDLDADTDSPLAARPDLNDLATKLNQIRNHVSSFMRTVLDDVDAATARTTLGAVASSGGSLTNPTVFGTVAGNPTASGNWTFSGQIRLSNTNDVGLATSTHAFQIGPDSGNNIAMDGNEIMARNNGAASSLLLNSEGGLVQIGSGGLAVSGTITQGGTAVITTSGTATLSNKTHTNPAYTTQILADGATINWNAANGSIAIVTLGGNRTMAAPTNLKAGVYILHVVQDATGSRTISWDAVFKWPAGVAPTLSTAANARDIISFISDGTNLYGSYMLDVK